MKRVLLVTILFLIAACGKKNNDESVLPRTANVANFNFPRTQTASFQEVQVFNNNSVEMQKQVTAFLASSYEPNKDFGNIPSSGGLLVTGRIELDQGQNIILNSGAIFFRVFDSYASSQGELRFSLPLFEARAGANPILLTFQDQYSIVYVEGVINNGTEFRARLRYKTIVNPLPTWIPKDPQGNPLVEGALGEFTVPVCSFFKCLP
jgi:hypothetical protein